MRGAGHLLLPAAGWWRLRCSFLIRMFKLALSNHAATLADAAVQEEAECDLCSLHLAQSYGIDMPVAITLSEAHNLAGCCTACLALVGVYGLSSESARQLYKFLSDCCTHLRSQLGLVPKRCMRCRGHGVPDRRLQQRRRCPPSTRLRSGCRRHLAHLQVRPPCGQQSAGHASRDLLC